MNLHLTPLGQLRALFGRNTLLLSCLRCEKQMSEAVSHTAIRVLCLGRICLKFEAIEIRKKKKLKQSIEHPSENALCLSSHFG